MKKKELKNRQIDDNLFREYPHLFDIEESDDHLFVIVMSIVAFVISMVLGLVFGVLL